MREETERIKVIMIETGGWGGYAIIPLSGLRSSHRIGKSNLVPAGCFNVK